MLRLHGRAISGGATLGTAAVVRWEWGVAQLPARILEEMARAARLGSAEPIEVILVAQESSKAAALTLPGIRVVGLLAESDEAPDGGTDYPVIVGIEDATRKVPDDVLILIDGDRGVALVDPDGMTVAAYQAERER